MSGLNISYRISAVDNFSSTMSKLESSVKSATSEFERLSSAAKSIGGAVTAVGAAGTLVVGAAMKKGVEYNAMLEQSAIAWETLLGSQEKALEMQSTIAELGKESPFNYESFDKTGKLLAAMGVESSELPKYMENIGDAVSAVGGGSPELERVGLAFAQMSAKGKVSAEEMNQLAENGIPAWKLLSEQTGKSVQDLMKLGEEGKLFADEALPLIMKGIEDSFGGSMEKATGSFSGQLEKLKEQIRESLGAISMPIFEVLKDVLPVINNALEKLTNWFKSLSPEMQKMIAVGILLAPIITMIAGGFILFLGFLPQIMGFISNVMTGFSMLTKIFTLFANPIGLIILGIGLLIAAFVLAYQKIDWFREMVDEAWAWIKNAFSTALEFIREIVETVISEVSSFLGEQLAKIQAFWDEHGAAIMELVKTYFEQVRGNIEMVMGIIRGIFEIVWPIISGVVKIAWELIKTVIGTALDIILGLLDAGMSLLQGDWEGAWDAIKGIAEDIWNNIESFFENVDLFEIGKDIIAGLVSGIGSMFSAVKKKVGELADSIPSWAKKMLGIHSPSRVLEEEVGQWLPAGIAEGITGGLNVVKKATNAMSETAIPRIDTRQAAIETGMTAVEVESTTQQQSEPQPINVERMFEGAVINVQNGYDVKEMMREAAEFLQSSKRRKGVR